MSQHTHVRKFHSCKKYMPSDKKIKNLRSNIYRYIPLLKSISENFNMSDPEDLRMQIYNYMISILDVFSENGYIYSRLYEFQAMKNIIKNPSIITQVYPHIQDKPNVDTLYTSDMNRTQKLVLVNALDELKRIIEVAAKYSISLDSDSQTSTNRAKIEFLPKYMRELFTGIIKSHTIQGKLSSVIQNELSLCEDFLRQSLKKSLHDLYDFFSSFDLLNLYMASYNSTSTKFNFADLDYNSCSNDISDNISLEETFSEKFLDSLSVEQLCFFTAFWYNRLAKECDILNLVFSTVDSLDLWQDIIDGNTKLNLSDKSLIYALKKFHFISQVCTDTFNIYHQNRTSAALKNGADASAQTNNDYSSYYSKLHNYINDEYCDYFDEFLSSNSFAEDAGFILPFVNLKLFAYNHKNGILEPIIQNFLNNNCCKNWGIIRNELSENGDYFDPLKENQPMVLVAFDIEGFNMPFRFHMTKDSLTDLTRLSNPQYLIPEYQGNEDFIINGELIPTNIIMPILKKHKSTIIDNSKIEGPTKRLWEHLYFLMNGKLPSHLTQTISSSKKQTVTTRLPINYTDLKTGKRYIQNKKQFIEVDDSNVR